MLEKLKLQHDRRRMFATQEAMSILDESMPDLTRSQWVEVGNVLLHIHSEHGARKHGRRLAQSFRDVPQGLEDRVVEAWHAVKSNSIEDNIATAVRRSLSIRKKALVVQQDQTPRTTYEKMLQRGIELTMRNEDRETLKQLSLRHPDKPLIQLVNYRKLLTSVGYGPEEDATTYGFIFIHDMLDHFFLTYLQHQPYLDGASIHSRYQQLTQRLGNPYTTNMAELKAEPFAHAGHAWRESHLSYAHSPSDMSIGIMIQILNRSKTKTENQNRILQTLQGLQSSKKPDDKKLADQLAFVYRQCIEVMASQNLSYGPLYDLDAQQKPRGKFPLYDPEYLSYVCDTVLLCNQNEEMVVNAVDVAQIQLENYLQGVVRGNVPTELAFQIKLPDLLSDPTNFDRYGLLDSLQSERWYSANWSKRNRREAL